MYKHTGLLLALAAALVATSEAVSLRTLGKKKCDYECPEHSEPIPFRRCYDNFDDCVCEEGYAKYKGECVSCDYECPEYSYRKKFRKCYNNFGKVFVLRQRYFASLDVTLKKP